MADKKTSNPWRTLSSEEVYRDPWVRLRKDQVIRPDGSPGTYTVVGVGNNAAIIALSPQQEVYLVGEYLYPLQTYSWQVPSGAVPPEEAPLAAARRELEEEIGLIAGEWQELGAFYMSGGISTQTSYVFLAKGLQQTTAHPEPTERLAVKKVPLETARQMCYQGEIKDAPSIVGILWAANYLNSAKQDGS